MTDQKNETGESQKAETPADQVLEVGKNAIETAQEAVAQAQSAIEKLQQEGQRILQSMIGETQKMAEDRVTEMRDRFDEARERAGETFDNLEQLFEERVSKALGRLGIPSRDDFQAIAKRLEELNNSVQTLIESRGQPPVSAGKDDLKEISGLGPVLESKLNAKGIYTYRQIATMSAEDVERIETEVIHSSGRVHRENWINQARDLHFQKYGEQL